jgi:hypothetical protein
MRSYHRWSDVLPDVDPFAVDPERALRSLVTRYVRAFGPVSLEDISWWTGLGKGRCRRALEAVASLVEEAAVDGWPGPLYVRRDATFGGEDPGGVRALPLLDPYVQGYRHRVRFVDAARHDHVYDAGGNATATLVHHGRIIGVWQDAKRAALHHFFDRPSPAVRRSSAKELARVGEFLHGRAVDVVEVPQMPSLRAGGGRTASHPLDGQIRRASRRTAG